MDGEEKRVGPCDSFAIHRKPPMAANASNPARSWTVSLPLVTKAMDTAALSEIFHVGYMFKDGEIRRT
ncbi:hypothetical protein KIN_03110 [Litoreibacter roseus]|uniref:Uncharacterized protein n=1 Tax=Litoreibacter roseus TaxID=2601869 RepID=A0A6N6JB65_9RHOB|nr:hypothetical protein KIN_03110 [Litoreibacter roseus]